LSQNKPFHSDFWGVSGTKSKYFSLVDDIFDDNFWKILQNLEFFFLVYLVVCLSLGFEISSIQQIIFVPG